jgi:hypothetical protein
MVMTTRTKYGAIFTGLAIVILFSGCASPTNDGSAVAIHQGDPLTSFSQEITSPIHEFQVKAGEAYTLDITVKNTGTQPWFGSAPTMSVNAGYRWHDSKGTVLPIEGNRAKLDRSVLNPGETAQLKLIVVAPPTPDAYTLHVSMVQEGVNWFFMAGAKPLVLHVTVT